MSQATNQQLALTQSRREFLDRSKLIAVGGLAALHSVSCSSIAIGADETLPRFDPPGNLNDMNDEQKKKWSEFISRRMDREIAGDLEGRRLQFYNPTKTATTSDKATATISWTAFPNFVKLTSATDQLRWRRADASRDRQDEYCEWSVSKNGDGKITKVTFTCEGPEYWETLAAVNQTKVLELYRTFVEPSIQLIDLYPDGMNYDPRNRFNNSTTGGAMHLIQGANTLGAEINIVARATILRKIGGSLLQGEQELIECGGYGAKERNSDPHIGGEVNSLARLGAMVTISNPVGLYFQDLFTTSSWVTPDGSNPKDYWKIVRGDAELGVRAVYEVPPGKGFVVGDIKINGRTIDFGAQIADFIKIKVLGLACRFGQAGQPVKTTCPTGTFTPNDASVSDILDSVLRYKNRRN